MSKKKDSTNYLLDRIWQNYNLSDIPFLFKLKEKMVNFSPYKGLKIYHNIPLTFEAVIKIHLLTLGGANVVASGVSVVSPNPAALNILIQAGIEVDLKKAMYNKPFDIYLDCCAELTNFLPPSLGTIELTQTGSNLYQKNNLLYPVISIGDSKLKQLEAIGTGLSCVKAITHLTKQDFCGKKFIVFGYGKVGKGVVKALETFTDKIVIVDKDRKTIDLLDNSGYHVYDINANGFVADIKKELKRTYCIVTATGIRGFLSEFFDRKDLAGICLANAGAEDEFGKNFLEQDTLFAKRPVNFSLSEPTILHYLDPVLYAHNFAIDLLVEKRYSPGYHVFPDNLSQKIIEEWEQIHNQNMRDIFNF